MVTPRAPGVYQAPRDRRYTPLALGEVGVPGFVGVAERGPTNEPVRITSINQFHDVFGALENEGFLCDAVRGFFENGGRTCYVLRVAHMVKRMREETARPAFLRLQGEGGKHSLVLRAANEGVWGNKVRVQVTKQKPRVSTFLTLDLKTGDTSAVIKSTIGLSRGTIVRIYDGEKDTFRTLTELSGKTISWSISEPLEQDFRSGAPTYIEPVEFTVDVQWKDQRERFRNLTMARSSDLYVERVINTQSALVRVEDLGADMPLHQTFPVDVSETNLDGGLDGLFTVTPEDFIGANVGPDERFGLAAYEAVEVIDLLVVPDLMWALDKSTGFRTEKDVEVVQDAMVSQCERMKTRFAILDLPDPVDHRRALQWRLLFDTPYAAFYFPWIKVDGPHGERLVPPSGHVAGVYARCDEAEGPYRAPANEDLEGVLDIGRVLQDTDIGLLNDQGVNCLKPFPRRGIRVWGARTASNDTMWRYVNVRRIVNAVISSVERGLQWAVFEPNTEFLWKSLEREVTAFLMELWQGGYFRGRTPEEAFYVKCDGETNPPDVQRAGQVIIECGVAPVRPAEYLIFRVATDLEEVGPGA